ncbi:MAG: hypothetical protein KDA85_05090 [Planctomycetaceae bacterium]|nr:hypothetical protein [Planctomycetaceae bacterium]
MKTFFPRVLLAGGLMLVSGCGGTPVEKQERFQDVMNRSQDAAAADNVRSIVSTLRAAWLGGGEGAEVAEMEIQTVMEDTVSFDPTKFSDEFQPVVASIRDKMTELQNVKSRSEAKEILDKMEELAEKLPRE